MWEVVTSEPSACMTNKIHYVRSKYQIEDSDDHQVMSGQNVPKFKLMKSPVQN